MQKGDFIDKDLRDVLIKMAGHDVDNPPKRLVISPTMMRVAQQVLDSQTLGNSPDGLRKRHEIEVKFDD